MGSLTHCTQKGTTPWTQANWPDRHNTGQVSARIVKCMAYYTLVISEHSNDHGKRASAHQAMPQQHQQQVGRQGAQDHAEHRDDDE